MASGNPTHAFAICAYGQSPYLTECIESLLAQEYSESELFITTSTPSEWLDDVARSYNLDVHVNKGQAGIGGDWNFAFGRANARFVTIAHQDDTYCPLYAKKAIELLESRSDSLIFFSNYGELRKGEHVDDNNLLNVKRRLLRPLVKSKDPSSMRAKRSILKFGSAICCPSVTFNVENCPRPPFIVGMKSNLDWATWEMLSKKKGSFLYTPEILMYHRIHSDSATSELIQTNERDAEDLEMLEHFWPKPVAWAIERVYAKGTDSNGL